MAENRRELLARFRQPIFAPHPLFQQLRTFHCLDKWDGDCSLELPRLRIIIHGIDYIEHSPEQCHAPFNQPLRFQQDTYRLWYQIEGHGILQNVTRKTFGTARPGLLGVMERGERHTYLHQRGPFACFQMQFSIFPSRHAKCYWNAGIEGKTILEDDDRLLLENHIFDLLLVLSQRNRLLGLTTFSRLIEILLVLFEKGLILIEESRFPKNKAKSLVTKAKNFMNIHYADLHHQREIEQECGVDINYLNTLFKKQAGTTLYRYFTGVRIEHAKHLLETTSASIIDIAMRIGYPNANSFSRAFKRRELQTPQEYRAGNRCLPGNNTTTITI
ncbi:MAG: helix-turn-helix transcriptional regulator [Chitinispirillaceae bacterium]|nr:helix-turn-helix transcriptional regulator [Chitinispirillaceae bacterium]